MSKQAIAKRVICERTNSKDSYRWFSDHIDPIPLLDGKEVSIVGVFHKWQIIVPLGKIDSTKNARENISIMNKYSHLKLV